MKFTVLGTRGFIGSRLVSHLRTCGHHCLELDREYSGQLSEDLGVVFYCVGVTGDFRLRPMDTINAHVCHLLPLLKKGRFSKFVYLSSTRIYQGASLPESALTVDPGDPDCLYNISKIMGESACLTLPPDAVKIVRLSNVVGVDVNAHNFLSSLIRAAIVEGKIDLATGLESSRDFIWLEDVVRSLIEISLRGKDKIYNLAFGRNRTTGQLVDVIARETGCRVTVRPNAPNKSFPEIDTGALSQAVGFSFTDVLEVLPEVIRIHSQMLNSDANSRS